MLVWVKAIEDAKEERNKRPSNIVSSSISQPKLEGHPIKTQMNQMMIRNTDHTPN
jgi:hypothetical protein